MGGHALKIQTERKSTEDLERIASEIKEKLSKDLGLIAYSTKYYHSKISHGDLDMLLCIDAKFSNKNISLANYAKEHLGASETNSNGSVVSFDYENFQVDFIPIKEKYFEFAKHFFDYSPVGNLLGKIAHKFGLKYGFSGLTFPLRTYHGTIHEDILITLDVEKTFEFLGFDYNRYKLGFEAEEEIFEYVIKSKYFNSDYFQMENLSSIDKKRNRKRPDFQRFLSYIEKIETSNTYKFGKKETYIDLIDETFKESNIKNRLSEFKLLDAENKLISEKFNGNIIMEYVPSLSGKELGTAIHNFRKEKPDFRTYVLNNTTETIMNEFLKKLKSNE